MSRTAHLCCYMNSENKSVRFQAFFWKTLGRGGCLAKAWCRSLKWSELPKGWAQATQLHQLSSLFPPLTTFNFYFVLFSPLSWLSASLGLFHVPLYRLGSCWRSDRKSISLISHSDVRYRGTLAGIDPGASTIQLSNGAQFPFFPPMSSWSQ